MRLVFIAAVVIALLSPHTLLPVRAKAAFKTRDNMIDNASVIALVDIEKVEPASVKGSLWTYSQIARARPVKVLKGSMPDNARLYGQENFRCAQVIYKPGRALVFLSMEGDRLVGNNWGLSVREVKNNSLEWFIDNNSLKTTNQQVSSVISSISRHLLRSSIKMTPDPDLEIIAKASHFCDGVLGEAATTAPEFLAFTRLLKSKTAKLCDLEAMLTSATPQGKLYTAMLVYKLYPTERSKLKARFKADKTKISMQTGCELFDSTLGQSIDELTSSGKIRFLDFSKLGF
ncbi:MAG: hypothetical protein K8F91_01825 [Candidatus Obscuribacterales bacterium]|nr:hypothetical protein [Candidatus Obscuribacterales bacterium]